MEQYFNIRYEFDKNEVWKQIDEQIASDYSGYICVADGVVVDNVQRNKLYRETINESMFAICDSGWIPIYLRWIYGIERKQYCGPMIFKDLISQGKYRMIFMGTKQKILDSLQFELVKMNPNVRNMTFYELPFKNVEDFDYPAISKIIEEDRADIIWVALGAPKQDFFMQLLKPHLKRGVMIGVGAAFNFYSGEGEKRAPRWITSIHLEFIYRIMQNPKKQIKRCWGIIASLPSLLWHEWLKKNKQVDTEN